MSASAPAIREYIAEDSAACMRIFDSVSERYFSPGDREEFAHFLQAPVGAYYVVLDRNEVVGCGGVSVRGSDAILTWGMVRADHHGRGLGRLLAEYRLRQASAMPGITRIVLNTSDVTTAFYERLGFRVVAHTPNGYRDGLDRYDLELPA